MTPGQFGSVIVAFLLPPVQSLWGMLRSGYYLLASEKYYHNYTPEAKDKVASRLPWTVNLARAGTILFTGAAVAAFLLIPGVAPAVGGLLGMIAITYGAALVGRFLGAAIGNIIDEYKAPKVVAKQYGISPKQAEARLTKKFAKDNQNRSTTNKLFSNIFRNVVAETFLGDAGLEIAIAKPKENKYLLINATYAEPTDVLTTQNTGTAQPPSRYLSEHSVVSQSNNSRQSKIFEVDISTSRHGMSRSR